MVLYIWEYPIGEPSHAWSVGDGKTWVCAEALDSSHTTMDYCWKGWLKGKATALDPIELLARFCFGQVRRK